MVLVNNRAGTPSGIPVETAVPSGMISDLDGQRLRTGTRRLAGPRSDQHRQRRSARSRPSGRRRHIFLLRRADGVRPPLKPDVAAPGGDILSSVTRALDPSQFSVFDGTSMAAPHVAGAAALLVQLHPELDAPADQVGAHDDRRPGLGGHGEDAGGSRDARGRRPDQRGQGGRSARLHRSRVALVRRPERESRGAEVPAGRRLRRRRRRRDVAGRARAAGGHAGATIEVPSSIDIAPGGNAAVPVIATGRCRRDCGRELRLRPASARHGVEAHPLPLPRHAPRLRGRRREEARRSGRRERRAPASRVRTSTMFPQWAFGPPAGYTERAAHERGRRGEALHDPGEEADRRTWASP